MIAVLTRYSQGQPLDWANIAEEIGYKNGGVCSTRWGQIKRNKLGVSSVPGETAGAASGKAEKAPKTTTPRKRKAGKDAMGTPADDDEELESNVSPGSRKKVKKEGEVVVKDEKEATGDDDLLAA